jgi:hypothetical protein
MLIEEQRLRCLRTRCLGKYSEPRGKMWWEVEENCITRSCTVCTLHWILLGWSMVEDEVCGACSVHGRDENAYKILVRIVIGSCEHGNEPLGSTKCREFLEKLSVLSASQEGLCSMELGSYIPGSCLYGMALHQTGYCLTIHLYCHRCWQMVASSSGILPEDYLWNYIGNFLYWGLTVSPKYDISNTWFLNFQFKVVCLIKIINTPISWFINFQFRNFHYNKPCKFLPIFQFMNIIFATMKTQPSSKGRASTSYVMNAKEYVSSDVYTVTTVTAVQYKCLI